MSEFSRGVAGVVLARKRPVEIVAFHYTDKAQLPVLVEWSRGAVRVDGGSRGYVRTLEGDMGFVLGDWILRGVIGEHYACRGSIFEATYDVLRELEPGEVGSW